MGTKAHRLKANNMFLIIHTFVDILYADISMFKYFFKVIKLKVVTAGNILVKDSEQP